MNIEEIQSIMIDSYQVGYMEGRSRHMSQHKTLSD